MMVTLVLRIFYGIKRRWNNFLFTTFVRPRLGYCAKSARIQSGVIFCCPSKIFLYENTRVFSGTRFIISTQGEGGNFIMKKNSGCAAGLTVITGNHLPEVGKWFDEIPKSTDVNKDVVVEEDVWIGANVTIMAGVTVGRGSIIGAGSVCRKNIPPYSIVVGNPAKVVGFKFKPEEIIEHEAILYPKEERLPLETLEKNYNKYFINNMQEIKSYLK